LILECQREQGESYRDVVLQFLLSQLAEKPKYQTIYIKMILINPKFNVEYKKTKKIGKIGKISFKF
jgi:hypothetical protein